MTSFAQLKKTSSNSNNLEKLTQYADKMSGKSDRRDDRFWYPAVGKGGNGSALIRFLPATDGDDYPWVRMFTHGFQNASTSRWFIENCPTTIGAKCPVCEHNSELWNTEVKSNRDLASKQKRSLSYISNVYVIKDPANPENEGQVFLYRYGKKIWDKINDMMCPPEDDVEDRDPLDPFDFWAGATFKMVIRNVKGYRNYDSSTFLAPDALLDDDKAMEEIWKKQMSLQEFVAPENFKGYDELKTQLATVLGQPKKQAAQETAPWEDETPVAESTVEDDVVESETVEDEDDFFASLKD